MSPNFHILLAALLAAIAPLGLLITRRELQRVRTVVVEELIASVFKGQEGLPQIELVLSRYRAQSRQEQREGVTKGRQGSLSPYMGGCFFGLISFLGFILLFTPLDMLIHTGPILQPDLSISAFWSFPAGGSLADERQAALKAVSVAGFGFLGGYIFQLGFLTRSALNQELSALSFVRASFRVLMGIILAVMIYRALDGIVDVGASFRSDGDESSATTSAAVATGFGAALGVAFLTGLFPEGAISSLSKRLKVRLKLVSQSALSQSEVIPVEVIDGIDSEVSFRLQESSIYDVQNLAAVNPITLYAETPYGIFECFDWILQAQLCLVVGPDAFKALKSHNVRTIFDLERAVLSEGAPEEYVRALGAVILCQADKQFRSGLGIPTEGSPSSVKPDTIRHIVAIMGDDLHVHRLRALWKALMKSTAGTENPWLFETGWLPGEVDRILPELSPLAASHVALAAAAGEKYRAALSTDSGDPNLPQYRTDCLKCVDDAATHGVDAKASLRRLWDPGRPRKHPNEHSLESFFSDPDFVKILA